MILIKTLKYAWILSIVISLFSVIWFVLGITANFQREIDLIDTVLLIFLGIPSVLLIIASLFLLYKDWPQSWVGSKILVCIGILIMLSLSVGLINSVNTSGWLTERVITDTLQTTEDGKYEYQMEWINLFQKNSYARLYIKSISTDEETRIRFDTPVNTVTVLTRGDVNYWISLTASPKEDVYILTTTDKLSLFLPIETYEIDVKNEIAVKIE